MNINQLRSKISTYENRRMDLAASAAGVTISSCRVKINNPGEAIVPFIFSCKYSSVPTITFGYEQQSTPYDGRMPIFSASVKQFVTIQRPPHSQLYTGAELVIVSDMVPNSSFVVVATATGIAFSGPTE